MKQAQRKLLQRLVSGGPKPTKRALSEFFVEVKKHTVEELVQMCREALDQPVEPSSGLLTAVKKRLRGFGGKAADFVPYLVDAASERGKIDVGSLGKNPTLASVISVVERSLGNADAEKAVEAAYQAYAEINDISYKPKAAKGGG